MTPASRARSTSSRWLNAVSMTTGQIRSAPIVSAALSRQTRRLTLGIAMTALAISFATSTAVFVGTFRKGLVNEAVRLLSAADFEREYAGEKRDIFCAVTPQQSSRYLADAAKANRPAVSIDSGWCRAQYVNGYALIDLNRLPEAQAAFERLVRLAPRNARYLNELGYIFMKQKKRQQSPDPYRRAEGAADLSPDRVDEERCLALKGVGYDLVELGDFNAAEAAYRKCLNIKPDDDDSPRELKYIEEQRKLTV